MQGPKKQGAKKNAKLSKPVKLAKPLVLGKATKTVGKKALADTETIQKGDFPIHLITRRSYNLLPFGRSLYRKT